MHRTKTWAILVMFFVTILTSSAQVLYKFGSERLPELFTNYPLIAGLFLYGIGAVLMIIAFKAGEVTVLYPIVATSYIWVAILSSYFFHDSINFLKIMGIALIFTGVVAVSFGSRKDAIEFTEAV